MFLKMWSEALLEWGKFLGYSWYISIRNLTLQMLTLISIFVIILWISVFMYGSFYYAYMPQVAHERPVNLEFRTDCEEFHEAQQFCSFPSANFTLAKSNQQELLTRGQTYVVTLELDMPESPVNQQHGMFMTKLQMYSHNGEVVGTSSRTSMLRFKSPLLQIIETVAVLPSLLIGSSEQRQLVEVELFGQYHEDPYKPAVGAYIEVQSKKIEIYSAKMRIHARFSGLRYMLFNWPWLSAFVSISINMFFLCIVMLLSWYQMFPTPVEEEEENLSEPGSPTSSSSTINYDDRQRRVLAMLERERQKEREAVKREYGLTGLPPSSSVPHSLHKRSGSSGMSPLVRAENISTTSLTKNPSFSTSSSNEFRTSWDFYASDSSTSPNRDKEQESTSQGSKVEDKDKDSQKHVSESADFDIRQRRVQASS